MRPSRAVLPVLVLAFFCASIVGVQSVHGQLLYDLDFGSPPHTVGLPPVTGAGPAPRQTVSSIAFGVPLVVASFGNLIDQPCMFNSFDGGDQIRLNLADLPPSSFYQLNCQIEMGNVAPGDALTILFDTSQIRSITFTSTGVLNAFVPGVISGAIGSFGFGVIIELRVDVDLAADTWDIYLDGVLEHSGGFGGATQVNTVRYSTNVTGSPPGAAFAIDNVVISSEPVSGALECERLEFEDLTLGATFPAGASFTTDGVQVDVGEFFFTPGPCAAPTTSNMARVTNGGLACGSGQEIEVNNVTLVFDFGGPVTDVTLQYGEYGGTVDLGINGNCIVAQNYADLHGTNIGGVDVRVVDFGQPGQSCGLLILDGVVNSLLIGGQELFIDNLTYCRQCVDPMRSNFQDVPLGSTFTVGMSFTSFEANYEVLPFFFSPGCTTPFLNGFAEIENLGRACGGGNELAVSNVNLKVEWVNMPVEWLVLDYGDWGGSLNLEINGDCREFNDFADVSGLLIGGAQVWAVDFGPPGQSCGKLYVVGTINTFMIGGQELWLDNLRACPLGTTAVMDALDSASLRSLLRQNVPNPFNPSTTVAFELAASGRARLVIYDIAGRLVRTLIDAQLPAGEHRLQWDGVGAGGRRVPSGVYIYRLETDGFVDAKRMIVLK